MLAISISVALASCGGTSAAPGTSSPSAAPAEPGCRPPAGVDPVAAKAACVAKEPSCRYTQELTCRGTQVPDDIAEEERRAAAAGNVPCACVCDSDVERCAMVP